MGKKVSKSMLLSGQPMVEKGHSAEENHVSKVSSSCLRRLPPQAGQDVGVVSDTMISSQSSQYQAGMRCPHHSCREMHQSRIFSIQLKYVFLKRSGTKFVRLSWTASIAGFAKGSMRTNHCSEIFGSTTEWQRWQVPILWRMGSCFTKNPCASRSRTTATRASWTVIPR